MQRNQHEEKTVILKITANQRMVNFAVKTFRELGAIVEDCGDAEHFVKQIENGAKMATVDHRAVNKGCATLVLCMLFILACLYCVFGNANNAQSHYKAIEQRESTNN